MSLYNISTEDRIIMSKVRLQRSHPFFAYILMNMIIKPVGKDSFIDTMAVNEIGDLFFSPKFVEKLSQDEVSGVLAHEAMHIATQTFPRLGKRDMFLWNIATDYIINYLLTKESFQLPKGTLLADENGYIVIKPTPGTKEKEIKIKLDDNSYAEDLYDQLQQHRKQLMSSMGVKEIMVNCPGSGLGPGNQPGTRKEIRAPGQFDWHLPGDQNDKGEAQGKLKNAADRHANEQLWKGRTTEAAISAKTRGKLSSMMERQVTELLEPKVDWRKKLLSFVTKDLPIDYTMRLPGRRTIATGIYFPSVVREAVEVFVAVDVSGSIGGEEYKTFLSEICGMARSFAQVKMKVIFWSTYVDPADDLDMFSASEDQLLNHVVKNSGGTTMACVKTYCEEKNINPRMVIYLTDGYVESTPEFVPGARNLFVLSAAGSDSIIEKYGEVCKLADVERDV